MSATVDKPGCGPAWAVRSQLVLLPGSVVVGLASGAASAGFLSSLERVTRWRVGSPWLLWALPIAGAAMAGVMARWGRRAADGNLLTLREIRDLGDGVPLRMAPLVYVGTMVSHLFGGSAGREGTALQMAAGLTDGVASRVGVGRDERRLLLAAALAAGFGSVFGVPWAGALFALEIAPLRWWRRIVAAPACVIAALVGDGTVHWLGVTHGSYPMLRHIGVGDVGATVLVAPLFGICAWLFIALTDQVKATLRRRVVRVELRPVVGALVVIALTLLAGTRQYNGLSLPLLSRSFLPGAELGLGVWLTKLVMTSATVGSGFAGGEVTPLFVMGATLGSAVAAAVGGPVTLFAAVGMVATFGSAVNASLACTVMGVELFGRGAFVPLLLGCGIARLFSSGRSLYVHEHVPEEASFV